MIVLHMKKEVRCIQLKVVPHVWQSPCGLLQRILIMATLFVLSACASTGTSKTVDQKQQTPQAQVVKQHCPGNSTSDSLAPQATTATPMLNNCLPRGVIEIYENFDVNPEIREEFLQAVALMKDEQYADAIKLLKAVTGKTGKFSAPFINLGIAYARNNDLEKAEENLRKAIEISKFHPVANNELGLIYRKTGRYQEARQLYETLLGMFPDFLPVRKNLGVLCDIYIQDLQCAQTQYEEYLKGQPDDEKVKIWLADVRSRMS